MDLSKARPGQEGAIATVLERVRQNEMETSLILPPGYGKSDVIRASAIHLWQTGVVACSLVISPNEYLRDQMVDATRVNETLTRYRMHTVAGSRILYATVKSVANDYAANGECLLSATIQMVQTNCWVFTKWIDSMVYRAKKRVVVFVDEVHTHSTVNEWGACIRQLQNAGALIVVLTGTPMREDGESIVGFEVVEVDNEAIQYSVFREGPTPETLRRQLWGGSRNHYELRAHFEWTFAQAWDENAICHVTKHAVDVDLSTLDPDGKIWPVRKLSEMSATDAGKSLGRIVRHPDVIRQVCEMVVSQLHHVRKSNPAAYKKCAAIIFCANDTGATVNEHAEEIRAALRLIEPQFRAVIATTAEENGRGKSGKQILESFVNEDDGDILIVKQMAGLGLDASRIKVVADLSPVRSPTSYIQRTARAMRPHMGMYVAHLITLADVLAQGSFEEFIAVHGGATSSSNDVQMLEEHVVPKPDDKDRPTMLVHKAYLGEMYDTKRNWSPSEDLSYVVMVLSNIPAAAATMTFPEIARAGRNMANGATAIAEPAERPMSTSDAAQGKRETINRVMHDLITARFMREYGRKYTGKQDGPQWEAMARETWSDLYRCAGTSGIGKLSQVNDLIDLEKLRAGAEMLAEEEMRR